MSIFCLMSIVLTAYCNRKMLKVAERKVGERRIEIWIFRVNSFSKHVQEVQNETIKYLDMAVRSTNVRVMENLPTYFKGRRLRRRSLILTNFSDLDSNLEFTYFYFVSYFNIILYILYSTPNYTFFHYHCTWILRVIFSYNFLFYLYFPSYLI